MVRKKIGCTKIRCPEKSYLGGLCKKHYEEEAEKERLRNAALKALHTTEIEGHLPENPELRDELFRLQKWWNRACDALNYNRKDEVLLDEAQYATEWCIALAKEIVEAEIALRIGKTPSGSLESTREWVWCRFQNLEIGLMSNGIKRPD